MTETWEDRYKRAVANYAGVPTEVPLDSITIGVYGTDGYCYSSYTFADPSINIDVQWDDDGGHHWKGIDGPEAVAGLIQSFLSPESAA